MKKNKYLLFIIIFFIIGCQRHEVIKTHGISYLEKREKLIIVNTSNKNDTIKIFGQPATKGMTDYFNDNLPSSLLMLGSYDESKQCYNLTHTSATKGKDVTVSFDERADVRRTRSTPAPPPVPDLSLFLDKSAISFITCQSELSCNQ